MTPRAGWKQPENRNAPTLSSNLPLVARILGAKTRRARFSDLDPAERLRVVLLNLHEEGSRESVGERAAFQGGINHGHPATHQDRSCEKEGVSRRDQRTG